MRVFLLLAEGGMRTTMAFNASTRPELNPWGVLERDIDGVRLGKVLTSASSINHRASSWPSVSSVPGIETVAALLAFIGATDHAPGLPRSGDHYDDGLRMATGRLEP